MLLIFVLMLLSICNGYVSNENLNVFNLAAEINFRSADGTVSNECVSHLREYMAALKEGKAWAIKMIDSSAKIPSGLMDGNFYDLGAFDECLEVDEILVNKTIIFGQFCIGKFDIKLNNLQKQLSLNIKPPLFNQITVLHGICLPNGCNSSELEIIFEEFGFDVAFDNHLCQTRYSKPKLDIGAIATISFLVTIMGTMIISTAYDVICYCYKKVDPREILTIFSIFTNSKKIITNTNNPEQIACLEGIRVLSMMWIILGHRYAVQAGLPVRNTIIVFDWFQNLYCMLILQAQLAVDSFLLLSGLVLAYSYMNAMSKGIKFNILQFYLHRILRLTPVLAVVIAIQINLSEYLGSGPLYPTIFKSFITNCENNWWKALLYIQNYGSQAGFCVLQSWYLCVDTQLFILSPLILIPIKRWRNVGFMMTGFLILGSIIACFVTGWVMKFHSISLFNIGKDSKNNYMRWYNFATHTRAAPWLIGILYGYGIFCLRRKQFDLVQHRRLKLILWMIALAVLLICVLGGHGLAVKDYNKIENTLHMSFVKPAWGIALGYVIFACVAGYGGFINWFLSLPIFKILSKLTYSIYLIHLQLITIDAAQLRSASYLNDTAIIRNFWADFINSLCIGFIFTLAFESPVIRLEKMLFRRKVNINPTENSN